MEVLCIQLARMKKVIENVRINLASTQCQKTDLISSIAFYESEIEALAKEGVKIHQVTEEDMQPQGGK